MEKYVVLGASAAGINAISTLHKNNPCAEITLVSEDTHIYSRCIMHYYMSGARTKEHLSFINDDFLDINHVNWIHGKKVVSIQTNKKTIILSDNSTIKYDKLLLATGSHPFIPPITGLSGTKGICCFHDLGDCESILTQAEAAHHIVVLGAGLVGVDVVCGLLHTKKKITMIDLRERLLALHLDQTTASTYETLFSEKGVHFIFNTGVSEIISDQNGYVAKLKLSDGEIIDCDLLVISAGTRANIDYLNGSGIETDSFGLVIDDTGKTSVEDIYGAGDITGQNLIWPVAVKEGEIAANNMSGIEHHKTIYYSNRATLNLFDIPTMSYGLHDAPDESYHVEIYDHNGNYRKIIYKDNKIYGALIQGDLSYAGILNQLICCNYNLSTLNKPVLALTYSDLLVLEKSPEHTLT